MNWILRRVQEVAYVSRAGSSASSIEQGLVLFKVKAFSFQNRKNRQKGKSEAMELLGIPS